MVPKAKRTVAEPAADAPSTTPSAMPWIPEEPARAKSSLAEELRLLEAARSDMARRPEVALTRIAEHRAIYPSGVLAAERDLMELDALRRSGRQRDARQRARAWLAREPNGIHAARVREILKTLE